MKKLINFFGFILLGILTSCNAFKQRVNVGPGTEAIEDHTFEILLMLGVAFALGLWLGWILWNKYKLMVEGLQTDNDSLTAANQTLRADFDATKAKLTTAENGLAAANQNVDSLSAEIQQKNLKIEENEADLDDLMLQYRDLDTKYGLTIASTPESKEVPMEVTTSPTDIFVSDLAADFADEVAPEELDVAVLPEIETVSENVVAPEVDMGLPDVAVPLFDIPEMEAPKMEEPEIEISKVEMPVADLPTIEFPEVEFPKVEVETLPPVVEIPEIKAEEVTETVVISIPEPTQTEILATEFQSEIPAEKLLPVEEITVEEPVILNEPNEVIWIEEPKTIDQILDEPDEVIWIEKPKTIDQILDETLGEPEQEPEPIAEEPIPLMTFSDAAAPLLAPKPVSEKRDDLKVVEGIGPKIEEMMFRNGIYTFTQLAATPVNRLKEMLVAEGPNYAMHDPGTWPAQSLLAANAEWENLRAYQSFLNAGKRPS